MKKLFAMFLAVLMLATVAFPVSAAEGDFVPSIEVKPGPGIVPDVDDDGVPSYGEIVMPDGSVVPVPEGSIVIIPIGDSENVSEEIQKALDEAYDALKNADSLEDLIENLQAILDELFDGVKAEDLVVTDLFYIDVTGDYEQYINEGGKLKVVVSSTSDVILGLMENNDNWKALFGENFVDNGDGTYTLLIDAKGVYALVKNAASVDVDPENPGQDSPTTGDTTYVYIIGAVVFAALAGALLVVAKKQKV